MDIQESHIRLEEQELYPGPVCVSCCLSHMVFVVASSAWCLFCSSWGGIVPVELLCSHPQIPAGLGEREKARKAPKSSRGNKGPSGSWTSPQLLVHSPPHTLFPACPKTSGFKGLHPNSSCHLSFQHCLPGQVPAGSTRSPRSSRFVR